MDYMYSQNGLHIVKQNGGGIDDDFDHPGIANILWRFAIPG
jgi:hypothetical protein